METEVMARFPVPVIATALKRPSSGDQQTPYQPLSAALVRVDQVTPSGEVMTRLPVPPSLTAQNNPSSADQHRPCQVLSAALVREVQVTPSTDVMTRLPVPVTATAQKRPNSADQQTDCQSLSSPKARGASEVPAAIGELAEVIVSDSPATIDAAQYFTPRPILSLGSVLAGDVDGRVSGDQVTLYCSHGLTGSEVILAAHLLASTQP